MDISQQLQQQIIDAAQNRQALQIIGNNSKAFYGCAIDDENTLPLVVSEHSSIIDYQPSELTITARAGTPLIEIIELLAEHGQMLAFEPPAFDGKASLGGCIATALAGPRRPWTGSVRDYVIGMRVLTGDGKDIRVGGRVMKNVAGYDLFRPMAGALGTLGVMLDITLKLLPLPERETSFSMKMDTAPMQGMLRDWGYASMPLSASSYYNGMLSVRLSGSTAAINAALCKLPSDMQEISNDYWHKLNEHKLPFFDNPTPLYRLVVPGYAPCVSLAGETLIDWAGALRWIKTSSTFREVQSQVAALGGTASVYRNGLRNEDVFSPLSGPLLALHKRIKDVMDPVGILNPGRLYREL
ncbi:MAG: glycolate oxidase subunit GlcE [Gammaproteobacteria bacterium]|nr:MAG: glycolate oxidase subunit GlcE [Gammaproteobacteria bacterium]